MRYLVLTDIHANLEALDACIADARARGFDRTLVLGDLVGYGADPNAVIDRVQGLEERAAHLRQAMVDARLRHRAYTREFGEDPADIRDWVWPSAGGIDPPTAA